MEGGQGRLLERFVSDIGSRHHADLFASRETQLEPGNRDLRNPEIGARGTVTSLNRDLERDFHTMRPSSPDQGREHVPFDKDRSPLAIDLDVVERRIFGEQLERDRLVSDELDVQLPCPLDRVSSERPGIERPADRMALERRCPS
jgi:hypothetical protein